MDNIVSLKSVYVQYELKSTINFDLKNSLENIIGIKKNSLKPKSINALSNISFELYKGDILALIGHNGSGKTTLLRTIIGILKPNHGNIKINGSINSLIDIGLGFADELSGIENIKRRLTIMMVDKKLINQKINEIVSFSDLGENIMLPMRTYSTGMRMRLAFSIATSIDPEILIFDEIIGAGDIKFINKAKNKINQLINSANAVIIASHDLELLKNLCNKAILLNSGFIKGIGPAKEVIEKYINEK